MKKIFVLLVILTGVVGDLNIQAQSKYYMYSNGGGEGEYIDNLRNAPLAIPALWGIRFNTGSGTRGFVNSNGKWGFLKPGSAYLVEPGSFSNILNGFNNLTLGVEGWIFSEGISVRKYIESSIANSVDILADDTKSYIKSYGDREGLHIRSYTGQKIYMYDKVYFDQNSWTSFGPGKNNHPTIDNPHSTVLRIGSNNGIAFWGGEGVQTDNNPQLYLTKTAVGANVPVTIKSNDVSLFLGTAQDDKDGWIGTVTNQGVHLGANNRSVAYLGSDDNMYVGLTDDDMRKIRQELKNKYQLFVAKGTLSEDYGISPKSSWSDFVFSKNYNLLKISEVAAFIRKNNHLPDVPSAEQVAEEGYSQHDMNKILLQKIEELTLYTIQQQKEIDDLKSQLQESKK
jgi:hypothetical protein